jgi:hypothetical protein
VVREGNTGRKFIGSGFGDTGKTLSDISSVNLTVGHISRLLPMMEPSTSHMKMDCPVKIVLQLSQPLNAILIISIRWSGNANGIALLQCDTAFKCIQSVDMVWLSLRLKE